MKPGWEWRKPKNKTKIQGEQVYLEEQVVTMKTDYTMNRHHEFNGLQQMRTIITMALNQTKQRFVNIYASAMELEFKIYPIYQPLRSGRIWHMVNF